MTDISDYDSAPESFFDAEEYVADEENQKTTTRYSKVLLSSISNIFSSNSVRPEISAIPEISITDMSESKEGNEDKSREIILNGSESKINIDINIKTEVEEENINEEKKEEKEEEKEEEEKEEEKEEEEKEEEIDITIYVKDLDTGKNVPASDLEEEIKKSRGSINPLSLQILQRSGGEDDDLESDDERKSDKSHRSKSFLKRLKKKSHHEKGTEDDEEEGNGITGNNVPVFSESTCDYGNAQPTYIKGRSRNKPVKEFDKVFLAQELNNPISDENNEANLNSGAIWTMEFSKDGKFLATGGQDKIVRVWAVISSDEEREHFLEGSDGTSVYEGISGAKLRAPVFRGKPLYEYRGHTADVLDLSWSKNNFLLSSSMDKTVRLWHITRKECLCCFQHTDFVTAIAFHPKDDRFFLSGSLDCKLRLWNIPAKKVSHWNEIPDQQLITAVGFTFDGKMAVAGSFSGLCLFYETVGLKYNTQIHVRSTRGRNSTGKKITGIEAMPGTVPGQDKLLISSNDSRIRLYNMRDKSLEFKYKGHENTCSQIRATFSDDGRYIITGSEDRHVYIFNTDKSINPHEGSHWLKKDKICYESFEAHEAIVTVAIFAPTRTKQLIGLCGDPIFTKTINSEKQTYPDGNIIVSADYTGRIRVFRQDCAYYSFGDVDSRSIRSTRSFNSVLGNNLNSLFVRQKQKKNGETRPRRKSDASSILSFASSILSTDVPIDGSTNADTITEDAEQFQCNCGSTDFKAYMSQGKSKLICANCNKVA
ncbi:3399_t:CDS:10 [Diversispora eburnea]|uniref:3399_t:CDS:1 n=1 Tax=Diversispora eburnea TaxID=1213867 RepID=A0A9N9FXC6_9GLOM|nr:3399_t:CDS:10 [Diversispora eburnea]